MIKGEYRGASLGWLVVILVALGVWALVWGPSDDDDEVPADPTATSDAEGAVADPSAPGAVDGPVVRQPLPYWTEGEGAEIRGRLELNGHCLQLPYGQGEHLAIVWPARTSWDAATQMVVLATGETLEIGDMVDGGGGYSRPENFADLGTEAVEALDACASNQWREVARFNNLESAARPG